MPMYTNKENQSITKDMSNKIFNDQYSVTEEELKKDTNWIEASKDVYKELEGVEWSGDWYEHLDRYKLIYQFQWDSLHAKKGKDWDTNPTVRVIEFEVVSDE